jgi:hypothetical protein
MPTSSASDLARVHVQSSAGGLAVLKVPGAEYQIHAVAKGHVETGRHLSGRLEARALKMHRAQAGGCFIEPLAGAPRIVQGRVMDVDAARNRLLIDVTIPMWVQALPGQAATFNAGDLVNFYVESGTTFTPVDEPKSH